MCDAAGDEQLLFWWILLHYQKGGNKKEVEDLKEVNEEKDSVSLPSVSL